jgi:hypothetical protein
MGQPQSLTTQPATSQPNKITQVGAVETFLVEYNDEEGKKQTRLVWRLPGSEQAFILNERVQGTNLATIAYPWFNKELAQRLDVDDEGAKSI